MDTLQVDAFDGDPPPFELLARENGFRFWMASDLARALGYETTAPLRQALNRALGVCMTLNINVQENFESFPSEKTPEYRLSRFACYLTVMNADVKNPLVAKAQAFFAGLADAFWAAAQQDNEVQRLYERGEISAHEKTLVSTASAAGLSDFARFHNAGYLGMYNMPIWRLKQYKKFEGSGSLLDHMDRDELAANLFRLTLTERKIKNESIRGQSPLEGAAKKVGEIVRKATIEAVGARPEDLPLSAIPIAQAKKSIKATQRQFKKLDKNKTTKK